MMAYEICGLTEEEADAVEMELRRKISGKRIGETNGLILDPLCKEKHANPQVLYMVYCYGLLTGMMVKEQMFMEKIIGGV